MLLQFCDFDRLKSEGALSELERLKSLAFLSERDAELVRLKEIESFIKSDLMTELGSAIRIYREQRFNVKLPAEDFATDPKMKKLYTGEHILVQGVIDCLYEDLDGNLHLVDLRK